MNVKIVYCVPCGYLPFAENLKKTIEGHNKAAKVALEGGKSGILDVYVDSKLIFSKHKEGRFPESKEILEKVK
ncbi:MAG: SelT/SelW/SelH family protein [Candidatus Aenigmarchaeota archaeon]|nr:SelT/SelW/SelH family protein [Candidatus Aenigmarchaeota archaeon]